MLSKAAFKSGFFYICIATFFDHVMRRKELEHLVTAGMIEEKGSMEKQHEKMLDGLTKWLKVGRVTEALKGQKCIRS